MTSRLAIALVVAAVASAHAEPVRLALHQDVAIARLPVIAHVPVVSRSLDDQLAALLSRMHHLARRAPRLRGMPPGVYPFIHVEHVADERRDTAPRVILFGLRFASY